jgi:hypothetical protein
LVIATAVPIASILGAVVMRYIDAPGPPGCAALLTVAAFLSIVICPIVGGVGFFLEKRKFSN